MKAQYQIFPPCYINGVWINDQSILREHYRTQETAHQLGSSFDLIEASARKPATTEDLLIRHIEQKRAQEERQLSTEYGQLLKNYPGELQRILREDPDRYDQMTKIHTLTTTTKW